MTGNVHALKYSRDDAAEMISQASNDHLRRNYQFVWVVAVDEHGEMYMYRTGNAAPADVTHLLGTTLARLYGEAAEEGDDLPE